VLLEEVVDGGEVGVPARLLVLVNIDLQQQQQQSKQGGCVCVPEASTLFAALRSMLRPAVVDDSAKIQMLRFSAAPCQTYLGATTAGSRRQVS
jgi:hypothetical protein